MSYSAEPILHCTNLHKSYYKGDLAVPVLRGVDLALRDRELLAVVGQSGSGKSTLLHLLGTLDSSDDGQIHFAGKRIDNLPPSRRDAIRNRDIGLVFQSYHLLPELTTLENVLSPIMIRHGLLSYWKKRGEYRQRAIDLLKLVGLEHRLSHKPRELSGGEMQRTAIARSLISQPKLLLADEPTGNLDRQTGDEILDLLRRLNDQNGLSIIMVTHDLQIAAQADRTIQLVEGRVEGQAAQAA